MHKGQLAEELYNLIVVRGKRRGNPPVSDIAGDGTYSDLPDVFKTLWELKAEEFAFENNFVLEDW